MKTENTQYQSISSLLDGELDAVQRESVIAMLSEERNLEAKKAWGIYHQIGDVLRSDDLAVSFSQSFSARLSARLEAEPVVLAPRIHPDANIAANDVQVAVRRGVTVQSGWPRYMAMTSMAAAAAVAFFMAPQIIPMLTGAPDAGLQISKLAPQNEIQAGGIQLTSSVTAQEPAVRLTQQIEMLRDPRLDSYLLAHQKFSPSIDNGAQYVARANSVSASASASASEK